MAIPVHQRVPNHTLRAIRLALRMSQSEFASAVHRAGASLGEPNTCNKRLVQKWESGEHTDCRPNYKRALQAVTRTPYEQLGFKTALPALVPVNAETVHAWQMAARITRPRTTPPAPTAGSADRLRFALTRPGHADQQIINITATAVERLFASEQYRPARQLTEPVDRQLDQIAALLAGTGREQQRRRLAAIGGALSALAGWLALDTGNLTAAHRYLDSALDAAHHAADSPLLAATLIYLSHAAAERGDPATGWQLAHTAITYAGDQPRVKAWAAAHAAQQAARLGERDAALKELHPAVELTPNLAPAMPGDSTPPWARHVDTALLHALAADVHGHLGEHDHALEYAELAMESLSDGRTKTRLLVLAQIACTAARAGSLDMVEQTASEAADLTGELESTQARRQLRLLRALIKPYNASLFAQRLTERLDNLTE